MIQDDIIKANCFESNGYLNITPFGAFELCKAGAAILDVREDYHIVYKKFKVEEVLYFPLSRLRNEMGLLPRDKKLIVADASGLYSREAMGLLLENGFKNVINLAGGMVEWERDGLQHNEDKSQKLTGSCMCQLRPREKTKK